MPPCVATPLREAIGAKGAVAVVTDIPSRARGYRRDKHLYAQRHLTERFLLELKPFGPVAPRFGKTTRNDLGGVTIAVACGSR